MGGKGALLLVLGFSIIFMVAGRNFNNMATSTVGNLSTYYNETKAKHIGIAGVNMVCNQIFLNSSLADQTFSYNFDDGTIQAKLTTIDPLRNLKEIISKGTYSGVETQVRIVLKPGSFSKYAYFSHSEGANIWWTTTDTVWGPMHTNGSLRVADRPVFKGKVTIDGNLIKHSNSAKPQFLGGFQQGVHIAIPNDGVSNLAAAASAGGYIFTNKSLVFLEFVGDSIKYKFSSNGAVTTVLASTFAPNGAIFAQDAELRIKGTIKGQYTVGASGNGSNRGKIYIDNDILYYDDPQINPNSTDLFGIVAQRDIMITDNAANNNNIKIQGVMYSETGSFEAENYQHRPVSGAIYLYGGMTQNARGPVGTFSTWGGTSTIQSGFSKRYRYDDRLLTLNPPFFPGTNSFEIVSWFE